MICLGLLLSGVSMLSNWLYRGLPSWTAFVWCVRQQAASLPSSLTL